MKVILFEDKANPGVLKRDNKYSINRLPRQDRLQYELRQLIGLGNCNIYLAQVTNKGLRKARKIVSRGF